MFLSRITNDRMGKKEGKRERKKCHKLSKFFFMRGFINGVRRGYGFVLNKNDDNEAEI